ncbi:MAG TPA: type II secretion system protein [Acidimicrobiales bacterium]|nr:type II secretion system protein [Acidimicrobiales bacterium]
MTSTDRFSSRRGDGTAIGRLLRRLRRRDEGGMTLIEVTVTVALTAIVMAMATFIVVNVLQETTGEQASIQGVEQAQLAERSFTQYLRSAVSLLNIKTNDITFTAYTGLVSGVPQLETIEAELCETSSKNVDNLDVIYGLPSESATPNTGWNGVHNCNLTTTTTTALPAGVRLVESFDITPPSVGGDIFTYYQFTGSSFTPFLSTISAADDPTAVSAIKVNITFLPPPGSVTKEFHTELGTTLNTTIFLRNAS